jgi:hypothetical protein
MTRPQQDRIEMAARRLDELLSPFGINVSHRIETCGIGTPDKPLALLTFDKLVNMLGLIERETVEVDQTDLGATDDRPLGPDSPVYRKGSE